MNAEGIKRIGVVGAGTMGAGIAQVCAQAGYTTILYDNVQPAVNKGHASIEKNLSIAVEKNKMTGDEKADVLKHLTFTADFALLEADVIIEAIIENLDVKQDLFKRLADINPPNTILATNTSSIPVTRIAAGIPNPERVCGMHFFNPAHLMKLVEVVSGVATHADVAQRIYNLAITLGKSPVMAKDAPGFIVNRIGKMYHTEPLKLLEENIASIETIDTLMEASGFKMGPFKLIDLIGVDANFNVTKSLYELFFQAAQFRPSRLQQQLVDAGYHGRKTGKGFYTY